MAEEVKETVTEESSVKNEGRDRPVDKTRFSKGS